MDMKKKKINVEKRVSYSVLRSACTEMETKKKEGGRGGKG